MRRTGFTLIELLVVIAVIAVLVGILVSVLSVARQQTKAAVCGSNIKQLALALTVYELENGTFPSGFDDSAKVEPPGGYPGSSARDFQGWWWFHLLADILEESFNKETILWCPSRNVKDPYVLCGNYGVNRAICMDRPNPEIGKLDGEFVGTPLGLNQIRRPAETLLIADSGYSLISWRGASDASGPLFENPKRKGSFYVPGLWINKERLLEETISPGCEQDAIDGRHPNKTVNVGFADGHLARVRTDDLFVEKIGDSYSNQSPLWHPSRTSKAD